MKRNKFPIFSIVVPVYNAEKYIDDCIQSILGQTFQDFEVVCIDDGSTDNSLDILKKYAKKDSRIRLFHQENKGESAARNFCIKKAKGKYLTALDADDMMFPNNLEEKYKVMETEKPDILFCSSIRMSEEQNKCFERCGRGWKWLYQIDHSPLTRDEFIPYLFNCFNGQSTSVYLREFIVKNRLLFPVNVGFEDKVFLHRAIFKAERISIVKKALIKVRLAPRSEQRGGSVYLFDMIKAWEIIIDLFKKVELFEKFKQQIYSKIYENCLWAYSRLQKHLLAEFRDRFRTFCKRNQIRPILDFKLSDLALQNAQELFTGNSYIKISIIFLLKDLTEEAKIYFDCFSGIPDFGIELIIADIKGKTDLKKYFPNELNRISLVPWQGSKKDTIKKACDISKGDYLLFHTDKDILNTPLSLSLDYIISLNTIDVILVPVSKPLNRLEMPQEILITPFLKENKKIFSVENLTQKAFDSIPEKKLSLIYKKSFLLPFLEKLNIWSIPEKILYYTDHIALYPKQIFSRSDFGISIFHKLKFFFERKNFFLQGDPPAKQIKNSAVEDNLSDVDFVKKLQKLIDEKKDISPPVNINYTKQCQILSESFLWDEKYYLSQFDYSHARIKLSPMEHYLQIGWKLGYNPSLYFDEKRYEDEYHVGMPSLLHFLEKGRFEYYYGFFKNPFPINDDDIKRYWKNKKKNKGVVYMCISGDYDELTEIRAHTYINPDWDYICFTDNKQYIKQKTVGIWQIKKLKYSSPSNVLNNRWHKFFPHKIFKSYKRSIYLDSNINILTPFLFQEIERKKKTLLLPNHATTFSVYEEFLWGIKSKRFNSKLIKEACQKILDSGYPFNYGKPECNIIYREHSDVKVQVIMEEWWNWILKYEKRDQFYFSYLLWKYKIKVSDITFVNTRIDYKDFCVFSHPKDRKI